MMRQLKITRDTAVKARTTAMNTLKQIIVHAPPELREALHDLTDHGLLTRCAGLRPGPIDTLTASAKHTLRALARRWIALSEEIAIHDQHLARLTTETAPTLREGFGVPTSPLVGSDAPICQDTRSGGLHDLLARAEIGHDSLVDLASLTECLDI